MFLLLNNIRSSWGISSENLRLLRDDLVTEHGIKAMEGSRIPELGLGRGLGLIPPTPVCLIYMNFA